MGEYEPVDNRTLVVTAMAIGIAVAASLAAECRVVGIVSRSDLLAAHAPRLREAREAKQLRRGFPAFTRFDADRATASQAE